MSIKINPKQDRIVIDIVKVDNKTESGIIIPDSAKERPYEATVLAVGPDVKNVSEGEVVIFSKYSGTKVKVSETEYHIIREDDIIAGIA